MYGVNADDDTIGLNSFVIWSANSDGLVLTLNSLLSIVQRYSCSVISC